MEKQFEYLINLAKEYLSYEVDDEALFKVLQNLNQEKLQSGYGDTDRRYQPINMLRAEIISNLAQVLRPLVGTGSKKMERLGWWSEPGDPCIR